MNIKKTLLAVLFAAVGLSASAQNQEYEFVPAWSIEAQIGGQHTLGEVDFDKLLSPNAQIGVGYQFSKVFGARFSVNAWQSKAGSYFNTKYFLRDQNDHIIGSELLAVDELWKWNYVAPTLDLTIDLSSAIAGYNPYRKFNLGALVGVGANIAFNNDEAKSAHDRIKDPRLIASDQFLRYYWDGTKTRMTARAGLTGNYQISPSLAVGLELNANILSDRYNSKKAGDKSVDWYFNLLAGVKYTFGRKNPKIVPVVAPEPQIVERVVEKVVEKIVEKPVPQVEKEPLRRDIFFIIRGSEISKSEMVKVVEIVDYLKKYPSAKVTITGYADRGTGNPKVNMGYSEKRANMVADVLKTQYGIAADRIVVNAKGDTEQPYDIQELNRVSICVAE